MLGLIEGQILGLDARHIDGGRAFGLAPFTLEAQVENPMQLRLKEVPLRSYIRQAEQVRKICRRYGIPFIVNDRVDVALASDADGVHLGPEDMEYGFARKSY